jgi:hypothetical protein
MRPNRQQHDFGGRIFVWPEFAGQQGLFVVEFELVDKHARQIPLFSSPI